MYVQYISSTTVAIATTNFHSPRKKGCCDGGTWFLEAAHATYSACVAYPSKIPGDQEHRCLLPGQGGSSEQGIARSACSGIAVGAKMKPHTGAVVENSALNTPPTIIASTWWRCGCGCKL